MLGQELVRTFTAGDCEVIAWDRENIDVTNEQLLREKILQLWPDVIMNATAYNAVDLCEENEEEYEKAHILNAIVPGILADVANDLRAVLVHYSTDYVFDGERPEYRGEGKAPGCCGSGCKGCSYFRPDGIFDGYREHDLPNPLSRYGRTKYEGELAVEKGTDQHYIIRLSKLFGLPAEAEGAKRSFFDVMAEKGRQEKSVSVVDGEMSCFTYAPDLALQTRSLIEEENPFGIYHVVNADPVTWYSAVKHLFELLNISCEVQAVDSSAFPRPAKRPEKSVLINTKRENLRTWKEALKEYIEESSLK